MRKLAELRERRAELDGQLIEPWPEIGGHLGRQLIAGHPQGQGDRQDALLGTVMEVALDLSPRRVACVHDPGPRRPNLL
jgi:hypothetical protein